MTYHCRSIHSSSFSLSERLSCLFASRIDSATTYTISTARSDDINSMSNLSTEEK